MKQHLTWFNGVISFIVVRLLLLKGGRGGSELSIGQSAEISLCLDRSALTHIQYFQKPLCEGGAHAHFEAGFPLVWFLFS